MRELTITPIAAAAAWGFLLCLPACAPGGASEDGELDSFSTNGKVDEAFGIDTSGPLARAVLKLASEASRNILSDDVGLGTRTTDNIIRVRAGSDGVEGTTDDVRFETLEQLDAVPYVGPRALEKLIAYARANGYVETGPPLAAQADRVPWSGYWWSMQNGELVLGWDDGQGRAACTEEEARAFDACLDSYTTECVDLVARMAGERGEKLSPLMKFDLYVRRMLEEAYGPGGASAVSYSHAARWELDNHYIGDNTEHRYWDARGYAGKCIGWALSTFDYDEPVRDVELHGVLFRPADMKGILASIYNGAQFFVPEDMVMGNEYRDSEGSNLPEYYDDVYPHDFVRALFATIGRGRMLEGDLEPADGVWNYPIYKYEITWRMANPVLAVVEAVIHYANDEVGIDDVFSTNPARPDLLTRKLTFELDLPEGFNGDLSTATGGRWTGESVDTHPDALILGIEEGWREAIYDYSGTSMNTEVNFSLIKRLREEDGVWRPVVDRLLAAYFSAPDEEGARVYPSDQALAIPDNDPAGVSSTIDVPDAGTVAGLSVTVDITHPYRGDLEIALAHPDGTPAGVLAADSGSGADVRQTFALSVFNGKDAAGAWKLTVIDHAAQDAGTLNRWSLSIAFQ